MSKLFTVTFVCLGNICRSPMAEAVFKKLCGERGVAPSFVINSRATSDCEEGNPVYPPVQRVLKAKGYDFAHRAKKITLSDVKNADYVLVMDGMNYTDLLRMTCGGYADKIMKLGDFLTDKRDIDDPWYTRDFERTYKEIYAACNALLDWLTEEHGQALAYDGRN
ncbi:MAG: low molecular weight phosphotyrosine protein phosphatase [Clostridia bacterium]|nr:low molecular weight phosphotyrosine protein phosphatase [Clostridia bacterium]